MAEDTTKASEADQVDGTKTGETTDTVEQPVLSDIDKAVAEAEKWKALSRKNEERAKANADKAKQFDKVTEEQMSALEKAEKRAKEAEALVAAAELRTLKADVAEATGLPAKALKGTTKEELEEHAQILLELKGKPKTPDLGGGAGRGDSITDGTVEQLSREDLKGMSPADIKKARSEGRLAKVLGQGKYSAK